jgi:hypothetical protein
MEVFGTSEAARVLLSCIGFVERGVRGARGSWSGWGSSGGP